MSVLQVVGLGYGEERTKGEEEVHGVKERSRGWRSRWIGVAGVGRIGRDSVNGKR